MVAFQRLHHQSPAQEEGHQEDMVDVVNLDSVVVGEEDAMTTADRSMTEDPVEAFHRENGGEVKHHRSASLVMEEEEGEAVLVLVLAGQMAAGMREEEAVGDSWKTASRFTVDIPTISLCLFSCCQCRKICACG